MARIFIGYFFAGLVVFATLYLAIDYTTNMIRHGAPGSALIQYYGYELFLVLHQMVPVAALVGTIFTLSGLSRSNELVALFSTGHSLARVSAPILVMVALISMVSFWMGDRVLPTIVKKKNYVFYVDIREKPDLYSTVKTNRIWYRSGNILFYIRTLQAASGSSARAQGLSMYYFTQDWRLAQMISAANVTFSTSGKWLLKNGTVTLFLEEKGAPLHQPFQEKVVAMDESLTDLQSTGLATEGLSVQELRRFISRNKAAGLDTISFEVDYHAKFSFALAAFIMSFLGIPFAVQNNRSGGKTLNIGICIGLAFLYWSLYNSGLTMGKHGVLPPIVSAWAPNAVILILSLVLLLRLRR